MPLSTHRLGRKEIRSPTESQKILNISKMTMKATPGVGETTQSEEDTWESEGRGDRTNLRDIKSGS